MSQRFWWSFLAAGLGLLAGACQPLGPDAIPAGKPAGWVADLSGILSERDAADLQRLGDAVHAQNGAALAVLTVDTTAGRDPRALATAVFNRWQLGDAERDNGILIFVAPADRAAEIVLGGGIDSDAQVAKSDRVMKEVMVPSLGRGHHSAAVLAGARALAAEFFGVRALEAEALPAPAHPLAPRPWRRPHLLVALPAAALLLLALGIFARWLQGRWQRSRPRACPACLGKMIRLSEPDDDRHLTPGQQTEEKIGSADHEVWTCIGCGRIEMAKNEITTSYRPCPQCGNDTARDHYQVLRVATPHSSGEVQVETRCAHCGYTAATTHETTPEAPAPPPRRPARQDDLYRPERLFSGRSRDDDDSPRRSSGGGGGSSGGGGRGSGGGSSSGRGSSGRW